MKQQQKTNMQNKNDLIFRFGGNASRTLSLDKIYNILMALKHGKSWTEAFLAIPYEWILYLDK